MAAVAISWLFIWNDPSPADADYLAPGRPNAAPMAAGEAEAHRAQAARRDEAARLLAVDELRAPTSGAGRPRSRRRSCAGSSFAESFCMADLGHDLVRRLSRDMRIVERDSARRHSAICAVPRLGALALQASFSIVATMPATHALQIADDGHLRLANLADLRPGRCRYG